MRRHRQLLLVFVTLSSVFLLLQILLFRHVSKPGRHADAMGDWEIENLQSMVSYENAQLFTSACQVHKKPVFLIDPGILRRVIGNATYTATKADCRFICVRQAVTAFGIISSLWSREDEFISTLKMYNFSLLYYTEEDPRPLSIKSTQAHISHIPTHYLFHRHHHSIHLVIFYERTDNYWWHGHIQDNHNMQGDVDQVHIKPGDLAFGLNAGAFDKMELVKVTLDGLQLRAPKFPALFLKQIESSRFIECNYTRARHFYSLYGEDRSEGATRFKEAARLVLATAKQTLDSEGFRFWISSGTCLGWFRQCDIIPYSQDVDIGMWIKDYRTSLPDLLQASGLPIKHKFGKVSDSYELSFTSGAVKLDIFFFYEEGEYMWNGGTQAKTGQKYKYLFPRFSLCWTELLGLRVCVPCDTLTYVQANYGQQWFQPVKQWDWKASPPNVGENGVWPQSEWSQVVRTYEVDYD